MERRADLVAAYRMPMGAFKKYAGTAVVADIIILKKRAEGTAPHHSAAWQDTAVLGKASDGKEVYVNEYWTHKPENVLGHMTIGHGTTRGRDGMIVERRPGYEKVLSDLYNRLPKDIMTKRGNVDHIHYISNNTTERQNSVTIGEDGGLYLVKGERLARLDDVLAYKVKSEKTSQDREQQIASLVKIRNQYGKLLDMERDGAKETEGNRKLLNQLYQSFVKKHGPINGSYALQYFWKIKEPMHPALAALDRITSYNVCYTKLLRGGQRVTQQMGAAVRRAKARALER